jgi:hypothetical protein
MSAEGFAALTGADARALADLERYRALLEDWNQRMNLVGPATLPAFWSRHALDSAQLLPLAPDALTWADLGAGAGLPGWCWPYWAEIARAFTSTLLKACPNGAGSSRPWWKSSPSRRVSTTPGRRPLA